MQLVIMAAVLALAGARTGAGPSCSSSCHLTNRRISVESCGRTESILTTTCEGQCPQKDSTYISLVHPTEQKTCNGDWSYEVMHIDGCPEGVTYPVARNCKCIACKTDENTYCGSFPGDVSSCPSF
ncbi:gonadotropin subunit beta-1-like [Cebidichthys violaceus]|uniref:gonadotropin subunit beta-1-like n=1 Tax=Cebidichthys violaceus TaxID=271503 RepID=UPI0035C99F6E